MSARASQERSAEERNERRDERWREGQVMHSDGVAVVTGGSRGIGAATAGTLARAGYHVVLSYRSAAEAAEAVVTAIEDEGGQAYAVRTDAKDENAIAALFVAADAIGEPLRVLVNNAATTGPFSRFAELPAVALHEIVATNLVGAMLCIREAVARMATGYGGIGGTIVNVSSGAARHGAPATSVCYGATKGALETLTVGLAQELAADGIRVNAVAPGLIDTEMANPDALAKARELVPLGRSGTPGEIADAIAWLVGDTAGYVSGAVLRIAGGLP
jgi:NAD(P)-dependent dehydrogenase (short-subunit alcohol dehydrogenase family)